MYLQKLVPLNGSSHSKCFVCGKKSNCKNRLRTVRFESLILINQEKKIYIKPDSRCCRCHLDEQRFLKNELFGLIPTKKAAVSRRLIQIYEKRHKKEETIFEKFNNIETIDDKFCKNITGWKKTEFSKFSKLITSINNTSNRSKEELIALYRYWLRKGVDQTTLALMFGGKTTQNQISHFLFQIRKAIYFDFVPLYLGSKKERSTYLKHNNVMSKKLYNLEEDNLAVIFDATYCRLEKSSNNDFQYKCWSEQKMDLLTKPFIACLADGWILDCYGPFQANQNDASILDYVLETDIDLKKILLSGKTTVFVDRGFRDIYNKLINDFKFDPKIPPCIQIKEKNENEKIKKEKQLTVQQTIDMRFVTKCRFIVEKQIGALKNHKALDNIRNTVAGHIQIDYRIACAMINFTHKPCCPENSARIADRIKKKAEKSFNHLEFLLRKQLDTKFITPIDIKKIDDFVRMNPKRLNEKIFLGSFQQKLAKSYLNDILLNSRVFEINQQLIKNIYETNPSKKLEKSKIIAVEITSRHKRSEKKSDLKETVKYKNNYKVFLQYLPNIDRSKSIKGYICSCKSGKKIIGCCVHVAALIYYLAFAKYNLSKAPASHFSEMFVNKKEKEPSNSPRCIKNTRIYKSKNLLEQNNFISSSSNSETDTELIDRDNEPKRKKRKKKNNKEKQIDEKKSPIPSSNNSELQNEIVNHMDLSDFKNHVPKWGGKIEYNGNLNTCLLNTCTIDYYLFCLWYLKKIKGNFLDEILTFTFKNKLDEIILMIENLNWNKAKELWINEIMRFQTNIKKNTISVFGSESLRLIQFLNEIQKHEIIQKCKEECIQNKNVVIRDDSKNIFFKKTNQNIKLYSCYTGRCHQCRAKILTEIKFLKKPPFLFIESAHSNIFINELPNEIEIDNEKYTRLCSTIHLTNHFVGVFSVNSNLYIVDDLDQSVIPLEEKIDIYNRKSTTVSFYYSN